MLVSCNSDVTCNSFFAFRIVILELLRLNTKARHKIPEFLNANHWSTHFIAFNIDWSWNILPAALAPTAAAGSAPAWSLLVLVAGGGDAMDVVYHAMMCIKLSPQLQPPLQARTGTLQRQRPATATAVAGGRGQCPILCRRRRGEAVARGTATLPLPQPVLPSSEDQDRNLCRVNCISFATNLAANFGCRRFRTCPDIVSKLLSRLP